MRWIPLIILAAVVAVVQSTLGAIITWSDSPIGAIGPDLMALVAVFIALKVRDGAEVAIAAWILGLMVDLSTGGGTPGGTVVGPMALTYTVAAALVFVVREAFFREWAITQVLLAVLFCVVAHWGWITIQWLVAARNVAWSAYWSVVGQMLAVSIYTAILMPLGYWLLSRVRRWFLTAPAGRRVRRR